MALFTYKSIDSNGRSQTGKLDAANEADLEIRLAQMGMELIRCKIAKSRIQPRKSSSVRRIDLINFCFHMEQLTRTGVSVIDGLTDLRDSMDNPSFKTVIAQVIGDIESGKKLSEAMDAHPDVFDEVFVSLVAAGELSGQLSDIFLSLSDMIKWHDELIATTKKILIFPAFVGVTVFFVIGFLMFYLVPQLISFIESIGSTLPLHTRILIATSNFLIQFWYMFTLFPFMVFAVVKTLVTINHEARYQLDALKLKVWQLGPVLQKILLSRFANIFAMMYKAGIPVLQCIEVTERIAGNQAVREALIKAREGIQQGKGVSASFQSTGLFPPLVIRMIRVGETTGQLDEALLNVSYFYDRDIKDSIERVQALIQPTMTVFLGALLGWVLLSVMGPVYESISNLQL